MKRSGMRTAGRLVACCLGFMLATPAFARGGFGGGGMRGGGGFGGMRGGFGGMGGGGGFGGMRGGGFGGRAPSSNFGGGFSSPGRASFGDRGGGFAGRDGFAYDGGFSNRPGFGGDGGFGNRQGFGGNRPNQPISTRPNRPGNFPTDGGFGKLDNWKNSNWGHNNFRNFDNRNFNSNNIRNSFNQYNQYNFNRWGGYGYGHAGWWGYPGGWYCPGWSSAMAWTCMGMTSLMGFLGIAALASSGNGSRNNNSAPSVTNVTYQGGNVYVDGSLAGTADDYYQQAQGLAAAGINYASTAEQDSDYSTGPDQWQPLGVFSLAQQGQTQSSMLLQLAINRDGIVRGNYFNQLTNESSEVYGSLDKQTQRVSWTLGQNSSTVFDTALSDLTKDDAPVLVHYGPTNTQSMMLVRLQQPQQQAPAADPSGWQAG